MVTWIRKVQQGQGLAEYALILVLIMIVVIGLLTLLGRPSETKVYPLNGDAVRDASNELFLVGLKLHEGGSIYPKRFSVTSREGAEDKVVIEFRASGKMELIRIGLLLRVYIPRAAYNKAVEDGIVDIYDPDYCRPDKDKENEDQDYFTIWCDGGVLNLPEETASHVRAEYSIAESSLRPYMQQALRNQIPPDTAPPAGINPVLLTPAPGE